MQTEKATKRKTTLMDLIGIEDVKLGFFQEAQAKVEELKASNKELEEKRQEIQAILDGIIDVMLVLSEDLKILSVNHVYYKTYSETEPEGKFCYEVLKDREEPCANCPVQKALEQGAVNRDQEVVILGEQRKYFEIVASPLSKGNRKDTEKYVLLFKRDVTLEKEYQAQYLYAEKMATVGILAAGVAHEINNPLTAIYGFTEGLQRRLPQIKDNVPEQINEDFQEYIQTILKECSRCQDIVQNLLTFSRAQNNDFRRVNLKSIVLDCLKILHFRLKKRPNVSVQLDYQTESFELLGDEAQLKQVVLNLVVNALDAVGSEGRIRICIKKGKSGETNLIVEDNGEGISSYNQAKIFDPFFTTKPVRQGTGIGLSTCYNIVKSHGGHIFVCSEPGWGSSFSVQLPSE